MTNIEHLRLDRGAADNAGFGNRGQPITITPAPRQQAARSRAMARQRRADAAAGACDQDRRRIPPLVEIGRHARSRGHRARRQ
jgi:hypothetical protein